MGFGLDFSIQKSRDQASSTGHLTESDSAPTRLLHFQGRIIISSNTNSNFTAVPPEKAMTIHREKKQEQCSSLPGGSKAEAEKNRHGGLTPLYASFSMKKTVVLVYHF